MLATGAVSALAQETMTLSFYDAQGNALTFKHVQALQRGSNGGYEADALLDPSSLRLLVPTPMTDADQFTFTLPAGRPVAFALNWPTRSRGYGLVILDHEGRGFQSTTNINFTYQAAKDIKFRLDAARAARPDYAPSTNFNKAYSAAVKELDRAAQTTSPSVRGARGQKALEQLYLAFDLMLKEYGPAFARANKSRTTPWLGVTLEDITQYRWDLDKLAAMAGPYAWVRIVFQAEDQPADYAAVVQYAAAKGIRILGLPVDSSADLALSRDQYLQRYKAFIAAFPEVEVWEVGNEVNGGWSSDDIAGRVADVAAYCKGLGKKTYLSLFWQLNTIEPALALFNWVDANLPPSVRANLDYVGLSQYQEQAPVGPAFDQIMRRLQAEFPVQQIGLAELGYWIKGQRYWWAYNSNVTTAKRMILDQYYKASLGYAGSHGGGFWWNYASGGDAYDFDGVMARTLGGLNTLLGP